MPRFLEPAFNCCQRLRGKITDKARKRSERDMFLLEDIERYHEINFMDIK
jgi:hypothetical protein